MILVVLWFRQTGGPPNAKRSRTQVDNRHRNGKFGAVDNAVALVSPKHTQLSQLVQVSPERGAAASKGALLLFGKGFDMDTRALGWI